MFGAVVSLSPEDLENLDRSEYVGVGYRRIVVSPLLDHPIGPIDAFTYEVIDKQAEGKPPPGYLTRVLTGAHDLDLPAAWIDFLESFG